MASQSVSLSTLAGKGSPLEWRDAVALVAQLIHQVRADIPFAQGRVPSLAGIALEPNGTLVLTTDPKHSSPGMPGAAQILQQLLSPIDSPSELRQVTMQAVKAESPPSLDGFAEELAKWEGFDRQAQLASLHSRAQRWVAASGLLQTHPVHAEAVRRVDFAVPAPAPTVAPTVAPVSATRLADISAAAKHAMPTAKVTLLAAGLLLIVLVAWTAIGRRMLFGSGATAEEITPQTDVVPQQTTQLPSESAGAPVVRLGDVELPADSPPKPTTRRASKAVAPQAARNTPAERAPTLSSAPSVSSAQNLSSAQNELAQAQTLLQNQEYAAASTRVEQVIRMLGTDDSPQAHELRQVANKLAELSRAGAPKPPEILDREYRSGEPGVIDAVPLSRLPRKPDPATPPEKLQVFEVHVNATGGVDSSRFVTNRPSYRNSWWTSTAKTWHFKPATKDGRPVRFVMQIVVDDVDVP